MSRRCLQSIWYESITWLVMYLGVQHACTGAGADFVMMGGMFAGHDQSGGEIIEENGKKWKLFYGMSSSIAMQKYHGGVKEYRYMCVVPQCYSGVICTYLQSI